jgi:hypothetical protein
VDFQKTDVGMRQAIACEEAQDRQGRGNQQSLGSQVDGGDFPIDQSCFGDVGWQLGETRQPLRR